MLDRVLLEGRVAIVSGIGPGMGRAIARRLAGAGADVALAARTPEALDAVAAEVREMGRRAICVPTDITNLDQCRRLVDTTGAELGRVDVLVNNAFAEEDWRTFAGFDLDRWQAPFEVNVMGTLQLTQAAVPHLAKDGGGSVVMITTLSIRTVNPVLGGYAASKGALTGAAQVLASELGPSQIRVNCVAPGHIWGESLRTYFAWLAEQQGATPEQVYDGIAAHNCIPKLATPEEISGAVLWFASDLSRVVTGQTLHVDNGRWLH
jgi:NAD(P)-dependent dehydrogenase (short-subunit alcohol dehydrogenase family)